MSMDLEKFRAAPSYSLWDLEKFRSSSQHLHTYTEIGSGTWKNSELCLCTGSGIKKKASPSFDYSLVRGITLLSPPYKLQTLPVNFTAVGLESASV